MAMIIKDVHISNQKVFDFKLDQIKKTGLESTCIISDFDRTLTYAFKDGVDTHTSASLLQKTNVLSDSAVQQLKEYYLKYRAKEIDPNLDDDLKTELMTEWWTNVFEIYIQQKLSKHVIYQTIEDNGFSLRDGCVELFTKLESKQVPLLIFSAGLGDVIQHYLDHQQLNFNNINLISNFLIYNQLDEIVGYQQPVIHSLNKTESVLKKENHHQCLANKQNIILLGDSPHDPQMVVDSDRSNVLRIGFLNSHQDQFLTTYQQLYDVVILEDQGLDYVVELIDSLK